MPINGYIPLVVDTAELPYLIDLQQLGCYVAKESRNSGPSRRLRCCSLVSHVISAQNSATLSLFEKREELRRVLDSKYFAQSPKKKRFLEFVSEQTFLGNGPSLNEYLIGVEVYDRGTDFSSQRDPIVRVQAHEIRRLLKKYYEEDAKGSLITIELPTGAYVPVFQRRPIEDPSGEAREVPAPAEPSPAPERRYRLAVAVLATIVLAQLIIYFAFLRGGRSQSAVSSTTTPMSADLAWFWKPFLPPAAPPLIVIPNHPLLRAAHGGDSEQTLARSHEIAKDALPEFRDTIHFRELKRFQFVPSSTDFTSVGETMGLIRLYDVFNQVGQRARVQPSRLVSFDDIKRGNAILLGGNQAWSGRVFLNEKGFLFQNGMIENKTPGPGEKTVYKPEFDPVTNQLTRDYALILMLPNERRDDRVLLVYGIFTQGSQAAIEYLTTPDRMRELREALLAASPDQKTIPPYFQALLTTPVENSVPGNAALVSVRVIPEQ